MCEAAGAYPAERRPRRAHDRRTKVQRGRASGQQQDEPGHFSETENRDIYENKMQEGGRHVTETPEAQLCGSS